MSTQVIPFGKYQGQHVEILETDPNYKNWLLNQPWFAEKYPTIQTLIVNNTGEPADTPEHNAMQLRFLDPDYSLKILRYLGYTLAGDVVTLKYCSSVGKVMATLADVVSPANIKLSGAFENHGFDYVFSYFCKVSKRVDFKDFTFCADKRICVELKTSIGDDYPAVLRQCKSSNMDTSRKHLGEVYGSVVVIAEQFNSHVATLDQVKAIFKASNMVFLLHSELENLKVSGEVEGA